MKSWILIDSESTTDIFVEYKYLTNNKTVPTTLNILTNGDLLTKNQQGYLRNYGNVWYHPKAISNILSTKNVNKKNLITYNSKNGDSFIVINKTPRGNNMIFTAKNDGIYYKNMSNTEGVSMISTAEENINHYTQR